MTEREHDGLAGAGASSAAGLPTRCTIAPDGTESGVGRQRASPDRSEAGSRRRPAGCGPVPPGDDDGSDGRSADGTGIRRRGVLLAAGTVTAALAGCSEITGDGGGDGDDGESAAIRSVLEQNARTIESEDVDAHMETIHPESPLYESTEQTMRQLFSAYDLSVDLSIESISVDGETAEAEVVQTTRATSGASDYRDLRARLSHELRTHEGDWKIYSSTMLEREFI